VIKLIGLLKKKPGLSRDAFINYYEQRHAPFVCGLVPMGHDYRRSYTQKMRVSGKEVNDTFDFDCVSELWFAGDVAYQAFAAAMARPEIFAQIVADEEIFLDRAASRIMIVDERKSFDS